MIDLTAIDILIEPDAIALERAAAENRRLRAQTPEGFSLDAGHRPHITVLQRYVRTAELHAMLATVEQVIRSHDLGEASFRATAIRNMPVAAMPGIGLAAIVVTPSPGVLKLQQLLIEAISPFTAPGGTSTMSQTTAGPTS